MPTVLKVISLTGVCSSLAVAAPCFVGVDVVGDSKSNSVLVLAKKMLTLSIISPSCFLSPYSLFRNVIPEVIFEFLREIGVFYKV